MVTDHGVDPEILLGQMRCFEALGEWGQLHEISCDSWNKVRHLDLHIFTISLKPTFFVFLIVTKSVKGRYYCVSIFVNCFLETFRPFLIFYIYLFDLGD